MKKLGSGGWRHIAERKREQLTLGGYSARTKADAAGTARPERPLENGDHREVAGRAGMFHALGSQGWERAQDLERQGLLGTRIAMAGDRRLWLAVRL